MTNWESAGQLRRLACFFSGQNWVRLDSVSQNPRAFPSSTTTKRLYLRFRFFIYRPKQPNSEVFFFLQCLKTAAELIAQAALLQASSQNMWTKTGKACRCYGALLPATLPQPFSVLSFQTDRLAFSSKSTPTTYFLVIWTMNQGRGPGPLSQQCIVN